MTNKEQNTIKKVVFGIIVLVLCLPAIQHKTHFANEKTLHGAVSSTKYKEFTWEAWYNSEYQESTSNYLNTNFGFRPEFICLNNQRHFSFFYTAKAKGVILGKESYLYERNYIKAHLGIDYIGEKEIQENTRKLKFIQDKLKENGTDLYVLFAPGKGSYYPEYIPDKWFEGIKKNSPTNYKSYKSEFEKKEVNYIDFKAWFLGMKKSTPYPLFAKAGIHWSKYGEFLAADSLLQKISEIRNASMPNLVLDQVVVDEVNRDGDYDIGEGMNLLFDLPTFPMGYPQFHWDWDTSQTQQIVTFISDSYFWGMFNYGFSRDLFGDGEFWYYNKQIYPDSYESPIEVKDIDIRAKAEENDVIILLSTDANLYKFAFGFIDQLYKAYKD
jgi:hypothetical protein|tara:strand:+ start:97166 stop:98314 length:1149 start_codon:yes stop_codon:yes gene_type:complete